MGDRSFAQIPHDSEILHERQFVIEGTVGVLCAPDVFDEQGLFALEPRRAGVGKVIGGDIELPPYGRLPGQGDIGCVVHRAFSFFVGARGGA